VDDVLVHVTDEVIDPGDLASRFYSLHPDAAVATFAGFVRDFNDDGQVDSLYLECYVEMAKRVLTDLGNAAEQRFGLRAWQIVHRYGEMETAEPIVFVATSADHRGEAFAACEFVMDTLKTDAPFWKREHSGGEGQWVTVKDVDKDRRERWSTEDLDQ
jgi:molybdopterin synthase catalytic subunit